MIFLILAVVSSAMVSVCMRLSTNRVKDNIAMLAVNYFICLCLACGFTGIGDLLPHSPSVPLTATLGLINGILYLAAFVNMQHSVRINGVVLSATFMKLGLLVPMVISVVCFREYPAAVQLAGFVLAVFAILLINLDRGSGAARGPWSLILLLLTGGLSDAMSKIYEEVGDRELSALFLVYTFLAAFALCLLLMCLKKQRIGFKELGYGALIGVPNFFSARFLLLALNHIPAVITYPTYSVATILVVTLVGVALFRERLGKRQWAALGIILAALTLLNI